MLQLVSNPLAKQIAVCLLPYNEPFVVCVYATGRFTHRASGYFTAEKCT